MFSLVLKKVTFLQDLSIEGSETRLTEAVEEVRKLKICSFFLKNKYNVFILSFSTSCVKHKTSFLSF